MQILGWIGKLGRDRSGNTLAITAAVLPVLMGSAGFAIDSVQMALWKRQVQRAADSAAIAGAHALSQGAPTDQAVANDVDEHIDYDLDNNQTPVLVDRQIRHGVFGDGAFAATCADVSGDCYTDAVEVTLTAERRLPFMGIFTGSATRIVGSATAATVTTGDYCLVSLHDGNSPGIISGGNSNLSLGCGIATNARASNAVNVFGSAEVDASPIAAVGGIVGGSHFSDGSVLLPYSSSVADPFSDLPTPPPQTSCNADPNVGSGENRTLTAGCYSGLNLQGNVTFEPGIYYITGHIDINAHANITGEGVTLVMTGTDGAAGSVTINGGAHIDLTAPTSGTYSGVLFYRDRRAPTTTVRINGGSSHHYVGSFYGPSTDFWIGGNAELASDCIQIVGRVLEFKGGGTILNQCEGTGTRSFQTSRIRLVA